MNLSKAVKAFFIAGILGISLPSHGKQLAIVVGIDKYQFRPLQGAVNDAKILAESLRAHGIELPDNRLLLNEEATSANFKRTWEQLLDEAKPGDQLIVTFAGHGAQEEEFSPPYDEKDKVPGQTYGLDETLLFYDFDPVHPHKGRISDDELYELFGKAKSFSVLFVADSCHSGGITRASPSFSALPKRGGLDTFKPNPPDYERVVPKADDSQILENVTYLSATENEALEIPEIYAPDHNPHGALSWTLTQALNGAADRDGDHIVTNRELEAYIKEQVPRLTSNRQEPGLVSRGLGREKAAFSIGEIESPSAPKQLIDDDLPIKVEGGALPAGITGVRVVPPTRMELALYLCQAAANKGDAQGTVCLGNIYNPKNTGTSAPNLELAFVNYKLAKELGSAEAGTQLDNLKQWVQAQAERGNSQARGLLARWPR
jgi:hypothetical protein